jgi:hypothetical protein
VTHRKDKESFMERLIGRSTLIATALAAVLASTDAPAAPDVDRMAGPSQCVECHEKAVAAWRRTHHNASFGLGDDIPSALEDEVIEKEDKALEFADKMGLEYYDDLDAVCADCHVSAERDPTGEVALLGVSCESCHGPAKEWMPIHYDFGKSASGEKLTAESEDPAHRKERIAKSIAAGMLRPENVREVAANCYGCHTVPNEKLVNVAGHPAGSDFELVSWSQGEVRHSYLTDDSNPPASPERKRELFVVGRALDLQYSLAAAAKATAAGPYLDAMAARVDRATKNLAAVGDRWSNDHVAAMLKVVSGVEVTAGSSQVAAARDEVARHAEAMADGLGGQDLSAVDGLIPKDVKGKASP